MGFLRDLVVRIKGDKTQLDSTLKGAEGSINKFGGTVKKLGGMLAGVFSITAIISFTKAVIGASEGLSDKFSFAVAGAKGAVTEFFNRIGTNNFDGFIKGLTDAYNKASDLAKAVDSLKDKAAYVDYITSGKRQEASIQQEIVRDSTGKYSLERRKQAAEDLKAIEFEIKSLTQKALDDQYKLEAKAWENKNRLTVEKGKQIYETVTNMSESTQQKLEEIFKKADEVFGGKKDVFGAKKAFISQQAGGISDETIQIYREYLTLMKSGEEDVIPKLFKIYQNLNEGRIASQERFNSVLRITNALLKETGDAAPISAINAVAVPGYKGSGKWSMAGAGSLSGAPKTSINQEEQNRLDQLNQELRSEMSEMEEILTAGRDMAIDMGVEIIEALGEAFAGGNVEDIGKGLLLSFANFLSQFGKMLLMAGLGIEAFVTSTETLNAPVAIAAGIAMMVAAGAIKGLLGGAAKQVASGGSSGGGSGSSANLVNQKIVIEGRIKGRDIYWSNRRYQSELGRNT